MDVRSASVDTGQSIVKKTGFTHSQMNLSVKLTQLFTAFSLSIIIKSIRRVEIYLQYKRNKKYIFPYLNVLLEIFRSFLLVLDYCQMQCISIVLIVFAVSGAKNT